ncbi:MAG: Wzz/FepE/Etk N-terminal domain-containing protein [bacterium]|nr:Wzz/FepE/Etk N-terminal domain-containing protein [bacterium]
MQEEEINLLDYIKVIYKYRFSIIGLVVIASLITTIVSLIIPKTYEASTTLNVLSPVNLEGTKEPEYSVGTHVNLIKNRSILSEILKKHKLDLPPFKWNIFDFEEKIKIEEIPKTQLIKIKFKFRDPEKAVLILRDIAESVVALSKDIANIGAKKIGGFCQQKLQFTSKELEEAEKNLLNSSYTSELISLEREMDYLIEKKEDLEDKYSLTCLNIKEKEASLVEAEIQIKEQDKISNIQITQRRVAKKQNNNGILEKEVANNSLVQINTKEIENPIYRELEKKIINISIDLKGLKIIENKIKNKIEDYKDKIATIKGKVVKLKRAIDELVGKHEIARQEYLNSFNIHNKNEFITTLGIENLRIIDYPIKPIYPISPKIKINIMIAFILSLFIGVFLAFIREYFSTINFNDFK